MRCSRGSDDVGEEGGRIEVEVRGIKGQHEIPVYNKSSGQLQLWTYHLPALLRRSTKVRLVNDDTTEAIWSVSALPGFISGER